MPGLSEILPRSVAVAVSRVDLDAALLPQEQAAVRGATEKRLREFGTGRACARAALGQLGVAPQAIPVGPEGAPGWPAGFVGSITHCDGYRACAVARRREMATVGIDAEPHRSLPAGVLAKVALPEEQRWVADLARAAPEVHWDRLLFSIKETVYKAWFPLAGRWLGSADTVVSVDRSRETFEARFLVPGPTVEGGDLTGFSGRWLVRGGLVLSAVAHPA